MAALIRNIALPLILVLAVACSGSSSDSSATATAAFREGRTAGSETAEARQERCDLVVGGQQTRDDSNEVGDRVTLDLTIRNSKTGEIYEVRTGAVCTIIENGSCDPEPGHSIGSVWPPDCR